jgi:hypothetical protein
MIIYLLLILVLIILFSLRKKEEHFDDKVESKITINNSTLIYIAYHDDNSYEKIKQYDNHPAFKLIKINQTKYFESDIFNYLNDNQKEWKDKKYVGIVTYSFERKRNMTLLEVLERINNTPYNNNIFYFNKLEKYKSFRHGNMDLIIDMTLTNLGMYSDYKNKELIFYSNYFVTTPYLMLAYISFLNECKRIFEFEPFSSLLYEDAKYYEGVLHKDKLLQMTGKPYYTHHCFVVERLPCIYFNYIKDKYTVKYIEIIDETNSSSQV